MRMCFFKLTLAHTALTLPKGSLFLFWLWLLTLMIWLWQLYGYVFLSVSQICHILSFLSIKYPVSWFLLCQRVWTYSNPHSDQLCCFRTMDSDLLHSWHPSRKEHFAHI
jgi:hypothetical protein